MKPHLNHIAHTLARKLAVSKAKESSYQLYWEKVKRAFEQGYTKTDVIIQLESEMDRIKEDERGEEGDPLFKIGITNAKESCLNAIELIVTELKGEC